MKVAVVAHSGKTLGGGLLELRRLLEAEGVARGAIETLTGVGYRLRSDGP